jgi:uncharacterized protein (TIGR01319 family)
LTYAVCADIGSTFTKVALVGLPHGELLATAARPTTIDTDVLHGLDAAVAAAGGDRRAPWYVCSSAGGGLRLAVVGHEKLVTAQAGRRVALTAGARVVTVTAGRLDRAGLAGLQAAQPDLILLVGGTDGGDADTLLHNAGRLADAGWRVPVVLAGNADAREAATALLAAGGVAVQASANVLPGIGQLQPAPARAAIRQAFLRHVIGGKDLSRGTRLATLLRAATPDAVLAAVELLADNGHGDLLVVDVGGATTDVYSATTSGDEPGTGPHIEVAGWLARARTVEGDLGVRWNAPGIVEAAAAERLAPPGDPLAEAASRRASTPGFVAATRDEHAHDRHLATLAAVVAVRRHARGDSAGPVRRGGRDLSRVRTVVGSGGVLRHTDDPQPVLAAVVNDHAGGWATPAHATIVVDRRYVLAAAGLLAGEHPSAALRLLCDHLLTPVPPPARPPVSSPVGVDQAPDD